MWYFWLEAAEGKTNNTSDYQEYRRFLSVICLEQRPGEHTVSVNCHVTEGSRWIQVFLQVFLTYRFYLTDEMSPGIFPQYLLSR